MDTPPNISSSQHEMRVYILDYFRKKKLITFHENIIYSEKVFKINAVLKWCFSQIQNKKMSFALWEKNKKFLAQYLESKRRKDAYPIGNERERDDRFIVPALNQTDGEITFKNLFRATQT